MEKQELLDLIKVLATQGAITKEEIVRAYEESCGIEKGKTEGNKVTVADVFYYIGGAIVFVGISIYVWQTWGTHGIMVRVLATLGSSVAAYITGVLLNTDRRTERAGLAFHLISATVMPLGLYVVFDNAGFTVDRPGTQSLIAGILFATYILSYIVFRKELFTLFNIIFGTWLFFSFTGFLIGSRPFFEKWGEYCILSIGFAYIMLGYYFAQSKRIALSGFTYSFGIMGFLGAALALGGWSPNQNIFWEAIFPGLALGAVIASIYLKSRSLLIFGSLYFIGYILKITNEYFEHEIGWSFALVIAGLAFIVIGYISFYLHRKYIAQ